MQVCTKCKTEKPLTSFYKRNKNTYRKDCKTCASKRGKEKYRETNPDVKRITYDNPTDRLASRRATWKAWQEKNREYNKARSRAWREANPEKRKAYDRDNKDKTLARTRKRQIAKRDQSPEITQLEDSMIKALYFISKVLSNSCSNNFNVDHIHPISKGGLHVFENLQILTEHENKSKGNLIWL